MESRRKFALFLAVFTTVFSAYLAYQATAGTFATGAVSWGPFFRDGSATAAAIASCSVFLLPLRLEKRTHSSTARQPKKTDANGSGV